MFSENSYSADQAPNDDLPFRLYPLVNGAVLKATRQSDTGFWTLSLDHGQLPAKFQGSYSTLEDLAKGVSQYSEYRNIAIGEQPPRPEIKFKRPKE